MGHSANTLDSKLDRAYPFGVLGVIFFMVADGPKRDVLELWKLRGDYLRRFSKDNQDKAVFDDEVRRLELTLDEQKELARRVIEAVLTEWTAASRLQYVHYMWTGVIAAARRYFPNSDLLRRVYLAALAPIGWGQRWPQHMLWEIADEEAFAGISYPMRGEDFVPAVHALRDFLAREFRGSTCPTLSCLYEAWVQMVCVRYAIGWQNGFTLPLINGIEIDGRRVSDDDRIQSIIANMMSRANWDDLIAKHPDEASYFTEERRTLSSLLRLTE